MSWDIRFDLASREHVETSGKSLASSIGLRLAAILALLIPGLAVTVGTGVADAGEGRTIATARTLAVGATSTGGGGPIDFWAVHLNGGAQLNFVVQDFTVIAFTFDLYAPGTTDGNSSKAQAFSAGYTGD